MPPSSDSNHPRVDDWLDGNAQPSKSDEYEVLPPDADADAARAKHVRQRASEAVERAKAYDDWYRAPEWEAQIKWRFSIKDMLAVTAIVAIALTVYQFYGVCPAGVIGSVGMFFWVLIYMERQDPTLPSTQQAAREPAAAQPVRRLPPLRISYSTADLLIAMTIAAIGFSFIRMFTPPMAAAALGFLVLAGIILYWIGAPIHRRAVLAWFILTIMYLVVSAIAIIGQ